MPKTYRRRRDLADLPRLTWGRLRGLRRMLREQHPRGLPETVVYTLRAIVALLEERGFQLPPELPIRSMTREERAGRDRIGEPASWDWPLE